MGDAGSTSLISTIILLAMLLVSSSTYYSIMNNDALSVEISEEDLDDILDELTSYITIKSIYAKNDGIQTKFVMIVKPVFNDPIYVSNLSIQLMRGDSLILMNFYGVCSSSGDIFSQSFWNNLNGSFVIVPIFDKDGSLVSSYVANGDTFYIAFKLENITNGENLEVSIISEGGSIFGIDLTVPFSASDVFKIF